MKVLKFLSLVLAGAILFIACNKEYSVESGYAGMVATGSLLDTAGNCKNIAVAGSYIVGSAVTDSNYVTVQVNFATGGMYKIFTDTQNGYSFQDSGYTAPGVHEIKLKATGTPVQAKQSTFQVAFDTSFCVFTVTAIANTPASYTLVAGTNGDCSNPTVNGAYSTGTALNASNTVTLEVTVTTPGSYSVTTPTVNGMKFTGTGNLTGGLQIITLTGSGTPTTTGNNVIPVTVGTSTCNFTIPVTAGSSSDPNASDTAWSFTQGSNSFHGNFYYVFDTTVNNLYGVGLAGRTAATGDTLFFLSTFFSGTTIQPGTTSSKTLASFRYTDYRNQNTNDSIYSANYTIPTANTSVTISSYDPTTRIITGTFSGTAVTVTGAPVQITNGRFKGRLR